MQREQLTFDILIIGAGPAGLSAAIALAKANQNSSNPLSICVIEKAANLGEHSLSGAILEPSALNQLLPDWQQKNTFVHTAIKQDHLYFLSQKKAYALPHLPAMQNKNNYIISLGNLCIFLGAEAEKLGVNIFPGFAATEILYNENNQVIGVQTVDCGLNKSRQPTDRFQPGINLLAKQTLFAEGCRGSLSEKIIHHFNLRRHSDMQTYGLGIKELWRIDEKKFKPGTVFHTMGWPLNANTYGGGFLFHYEKNLVSLGFIVGLDYKNPFFDPFEELQRFKTHPLIRELLTNGECIGYGARALNEGGYQAIPHLSFPGGLLIGCSAGFLNLVKFKGIHNAMYSGMLAADAIWEAHRKNSLTNGLELKQFTNTILDSSIGQELYRARNIRPAFRSNLWTGVIYSGIDQWLFRGQAPWTFHFKYADYQTLKLAKYCKKIHYPKPDGKITFSKLNQVYLTGTHHREDEPSHLILKNPSLAISINYKLYGSPEQYYCPANVYEIVHKEGQPHLQINAANCIHCKTCDIKDPRQNIEWVVPEGGDGPKYKNL